MKKVSIADPADITVQMRKRFGSPDPGLQARKSISVSEAIGSAELGYYRGHNAGVFDSYLTLKEYDPKAAKELLKTFGMRDVDGEWEM